MTHFASSVQMGRTCQYNTLALVRLLVRIGSFHGGWHQKHREDNDQTVNFFLSLPISPVPQTGGYEPDEIGSQQAQRTGEVYLQRVSVRRCPIAVHIKYQDTGKIQIGKQPSVKCRRCHHDHFQRLGAREGRSNGQFGLEPPMRQLIGRKSFHP
jgi:hypothetical protein